MKEFFCAGRMILKKFLKCPKYDPRDSYKLDAYKEGVYILLQIRKKTLL